MLDKKHDRRTTAGATGTDEPLATLVPEPMRDESMGVNQDGNTGGEAYPPPTRSVTIADDNDDGSTASIEVPMFTVDEQYISPKRLSLNELSASGGAGGGVIVGPPTTDTESIEYSGELQSRPTTAVSLAGLSTSTSDGESSINVVPELTTAEGATSSDVAKMLSEVLNNSVSQSSSSATIMTPDNQILPDILIGKNLENNIDGSQSSPPDDIESSDVSHSEETSVDHFLAQNKQYFILSTAGKLIYSLHGSDEIVSGYMGILQTIVSYFDREIPTASQVQSREHLKSFRAGKTIFVISIEDPLILVAVDKLGQSESQLKLQLDFLYAQILSTLTKSQISRVFQNRRNFDLRQLLGGTEVFLNALTKEMSEGSPSILLGALECLKLRKTIREKINNILLDCRTPSLLYGLIVADSRLVSVIRPRRHSLHPPDLYLLFSMIFNTTSFRDGGEHWVPICLPKFNSTGFLYAYINFFAEDVALVLISPDKNAFFEVRKAKDEIMQQLEKQGLVTFIQESVRKGRFKPMDIPAPLIRHFLYKSKNFVQFVMPTFQLHYYEPHMKQKLMTLYHELHGAVHSRHGHSKIFYTSRHNTTALAWVTPSFEMYCVTGATTKEAISQSVRAAMSWIRFHEQRLFVIDGASF